MWGLMQADTRSQYLFPSEDAPKYLMGFGVISGLLGIGIVTYIVMNVLLKPKKTIEGVEASTDNHGT